MIEETKNITKEAESKPVPRPSHAGSAGLYGQGVNSAPRSDTHERRPRFGGGRPRSEYDQKPIAIRRVTRVVAGGRRMSFAVALIIGDRKGTVGLGTGKAGDTALAMTKALRSAKKNIFKIKMTKNNSIPSEVEAKFKSARVMLMPNRARGLVAGSSTRDILKLGGLRDVTAKVLSSSKNKLNIARATINALKQL